MNKISLFVLILLSINLFAKPIAVSSEQVANVLGKSPKLIDLRGPKEWKKTGMIPNSYKMTFYHKKGKKDLAKWLNVFQRVVKSPNQPFGLVSTHTKKAKAVAKFLSSMGYRKVYYLDGGIADWIEQGGQVIELNKRPTLKKAR